MSIKVFVVLALVAVAAASPAPCHLLKEKGIIRGGVFPLPIALPKPKLGLGLGPILLGKCSLGGNLGSLFKTLIGHKHHARHYLNDILNLKVGSFNDVCYLLIRLVLSLSDTLEASIRGLGSLLSRVIFALLRIIICFVGGAGSGNPICRNDINLMIGVKDVAVNDARGVIDLYGLGDVQARFNLLIFKYTRGRGIKGCRGSPRIVFQLIFDLINRIQIIIARTGTLSKADFKFCFHKITCLLGVMGNSHKKGLGLQIINDFVPLCNQFIIKAGFPDISEIGGVRKEIEFGNDDRAPWAMPDIEGVTDASVTISLGGLIGNLFKGLIGVTRLASNLVQEILGFVINTVDDVFTLIIKIVLGLGGALDATIAGLGSLLVRIVAGLLKIVLCFLGTGKYGVCRPGWDRQVGVYQEVTSIDLLIRLYGLEDCDEQVDQLIQKHTKGRGIESTSGSIKIFLRSIFNLSRMLKSRKFDSNTMVIVVSHVTHMVGAVGNSNSKGVGTTICNKFIPDINKYLTQAGYPGLGNTLPDTMKIVEEANNDDYTWCADIGDDNNQTGFIEPKPQPRPRPTPPTATVGPVRPTPGPARPTPGPVRPTKPAPLGGLFKIIFGSIRGVSKLAFNALNIITSITINTLNDVFSLFINLSLVLEVTLNNLVYGLGSFFSRLVALIIKIGVCFNGFPGDRNICTRDFNKRYGITIDANNAADLIVAFKLTNPQKDFDNLIYKHTRGKGIKSIKQRSLRYILERINRLVVVITNYKKITRHSMTEFVVITTSICGSIGNSRQRNSGKQIIEKLLSQCGDVLKKEGYPDITIQVTEISNDCDDSNDDNTDWNGGDNGSTPPSGEDNGTTPSPGGDNGNTPPSGGDNGTTTPSPGGDNGNTPPSGGDNGTTRSPGGDNGNTPPSGGDNGTTRSPGGDNGNTPPSGGDNGTTRSPGGDSGNTPPSGGDNGTTRSPGGDYGNTPPSGGPRPTPRPVRPTVGPVKPTKPAPLGGLFKIIFGSIRGVSKLAFNALNIITSITINTLNDVCNLVMNLSLVLEVTLNNIVFGLGSFFSRLLACIVKIGICFNGFPGDRNVCTRDFNKRYGVNSDANNAADLVVAFKLTQPQEDFNNLVYKHTRGKGIKSIKLRSLRYILERISRLIVIITNYKKITRQSMAESVVIITSICASIGNSRQRNSGKQIIEKLLPQLGYILKKEGYPDITIQVTEISKDCDDSNDDNTDWNGGDNGSTPSSGEDNGTTPSPGGDNGNTPTSGGDNEKTTPSPGGDNGNTPSTGGDNGTTPSPGGDNGNTSPSGGDNGTTRSPGGDNGNTPPSGGDNEKTTPSPGGDNGNTSPSGGDNGTTRSPGGDNGNTPSSGGDNGTTPSPGGDNGNTPPSGGDNGNTPPSGGNNGNDNDCGKDIGDIIQVIPGVTKLSTTIISELIRIKITTLTDIVDLITKLTVALGGIIDSIVDGLGSLLVRLVAVIYKIGFCVNGYSSNPGSICTKEWNARWSIVGDARTGVDIIALYRVNDCKNVVTKMIDNYTGGKGIGSTKGFIKYILQVVLDIANIVSSGTITKEHFSSVFIYIISIFGSITNNYKQGSATTIIQRVIPVCAPIFVRHGCSDIRTRRESILSTINIAANVRFDWKTVKVGDNSKADKLATNVKKVFKNVKNDKNVKAPSLNAVLNLQAPRSFDDSMSFGVQVVQGLGSVIDIFIEGLGSLIVRIVGCLIHYIVAVLGGARNSKSFVSQKAYFEIFGVTNSGNTWDDHVRSFQVTKCKEDLADILDNYTNKKGRGSLSGAVGACFDVAANLVAITDKGSAISEADLTPVMCEVTTLLGAFANSASAGVGKTIVDNMLPTCSYYMEQNNYPSLASQQSRIFRVIDGCNNVKAPWSSSTTTTTVEVQEN